MVMSPDMQFVNSTNIEAIGYDSAEQQLHVRFTGGSTYVYFDVEEFEYDELLMADSKGSYLNREIKRRHRYERW
jgi:hypothetical protein